MGVVAETTTGTVEGLVKDGVTQFRGIPYAAPPVGRRRFRPPEPGEPWPGVRDCTRFGAISPQNPSVLEQMLGARAPEQNEDCLVLNVYTPAVDTGRRPVMVWIHGGSFTGGSGSTPWYHAGRLVTRGDVVVVTLNYRLGALGFLHLGGVLGDDYATSGNSGILDQVAALRWVADNIAAFGGDPARVTVFGESAGAMSIGTLLGLPAADGLFSAAVAQSGAAHNGLPLEAAEHVAASVLAQLGLDTSRAQQLLEVPIDRLLAAQGAVALVLTGSRRLPGIGTELGMAFQPVVDGRALPRRPLAAIADGSAAGVPLVTGTTRDEWNLFHLPARREGTLGEDELVRRCEAIVAPVHGDGAGRAMVDVYRRSRPGVGPDDLWVAIETDRVFRIPSVRLAETQARHQPATWSYWFTWASSAFGGVLGSCHALEIPFVFDNLDRGGAEMFLGPVDDGARVLAHRTSEAWLGFAHDHRPAAGGLPDWPAYDDQRRATMELGPTCRVLDDPAGAERALWEGVI